MQGRLSTGTCSTLRTQRPSASTRMDHGIPVRTFGWAPALTSSSHPCRPSGQVLFSPMQQSPHQKSCKIKPKKRKRSCIVVCCEREKMFRHQSPTSWFALLQKHSSSWSHSHVFSNINQCCPCNRVLVASVYPRLDGIPHQIAAAFVPTQLDAVRRLTCISFQGTSVKGEGWISLWCLLR